MPAILFGADASPASVGHGEFYCPECMARRTYRRTRVGRRLWLFGAALPAGRYGEYVECDECRSTFRPEVLAYDAAERTPSAIGEYQRAMLRILALMVAADGLIREQEIVAVQQIFQGVAGKALSAEAVVTEVQDARSSPTTAARFLARVVGYLNDYGKEQVIRAAALVSCSDGELHEHEAAVVRRLGGVLRLSADQVEDILEETRCRASSPGRST